MSSGFHVGPIDHVELFVPDRRRAAEWYRDVLGLEVIPEYAMWEEDPRGPLMISSDGGITKLALFQGEPQGSRATAGFHLVAFRVSGASFVEFLGRLSDLDLIDHRDRRVTADLVADHDKAWSIYFSDPFGHRLEVTTYDHDEVKAKLSKGEA